MDIEIKNAYELKSQNNFNQINDNHLQTNALILEKDYNLPTEKNLIFSPQLNNFETDKDKNHSKFNYKRVLNEKKSNKIVSISEARLMKDIEELKNNKEIGKYCEVIINDYKRIKDTDNFQLIVEFKTFFSVKFIFYPDYPFSPPNISYYSGKKLPGIFDEDGNILLENTKKSNWSPALFISHFIISIEILISKEFNNSIYNSNIDKYGKKKWNDYLREETNLFNYNSSIINELTNNIKQIKNESI